MRRVTVAFVWMVVLVMAGCEASPSAPSDGPPASTGQSPAWVEEFDTLSAEDWEIYNGEGHLGNGQRQPSQVDVRDGVLTITGTADGRTGGLKWRGRGQTYGQWDIRLRAPSGCVCYHPVVMLWGAGKTDAGTNPLGAIDVVHAWQAPGRDRNTFGLHPGNGAEPVRVDVAVDMTQWHVYHLVWQESYIYSWIDDDPAYVQVTEVELLPEGPMDVAIQLDWFPQEGTTGGSTATLEVDYVKQFTEPVEYPST